MAELNKATVFAIKRETVIGTPVIPASGADFIPLKSGYAMNFEMEQLENTELLNNLGMAKSYTGKENPTGTHPIYMKGSSVAGTAPEYGLMLESLMGGFKDCVEYNTVAGSTVGVVNVDAGEGVDNPVGKALLLKDSINGYAIRNIASVSTDALSLNFNLSGAPALGVDLGQAQFYYPTTSGHPSYTSWLYRANGGALEMVAGCKTTSASINLTAGQQAEMEFSYAGTAYYFNPIVITATNKFIDVTDDIGTFSVTLTEKIYKSPEDLCDEIASKMTVAGASSGADTYTCTFSSTSGKFTLTSNGTVFSILWKTGAHGSDLLDTHVGTTIGFSDAANDTGALTYTSDNAITYTASYTPSYDNADNVIIKGAELFVGSATDNVCMKASTVTVNIDGTLTDIDSICATSGLLEKLLTARSVGMTATVLLEKHEVQSFDKMINNTSTQGMINFGPKDGAGNWIEGKCVNIYLGNCSITNRVLGGEDYVTVELTLKPFVTGTRQDIYINYV